MTKNMTKKLLDSFINTLDIYKDTCVADSVDTINQTLNKAHAKLVIVTHGTYRQVYILQTGYNGVWSMYNRNGFRCTGTGYEGRGQIAERIFKDLEVA